MRSLPTRSAREHGTQLLGVMNALGGLAHRAYVHAGGGVQQRTELEARRFQRLDVLRERAA